MNVPILIFLYFVSLLICSLFQQSDQTCSQILFFISFSVFLPILKIAIIVMGVAVFCQCIEECHVG